MKIQHIKTYDGAKSSSKMEIHSNTCLPQETKKSQTTLHTKELEKEEQSPKLTERRK